MKLALLWSLLIIADGLVQSFMDDRTILAATRIRSGRAASGSVGIKASTRHRPKPSRFRAPLIADGISADDVSVTVEQTQSVYSTPAPKKPKNRIYVPPRWVQGEYGVEILEPGRWVDVDATSD
jgi:hypothetical protein